MSQPSGGSQTAKGSAGSAVASNVAEAHIDLQKLAEKIYKLFMDDLRVQQNRVWGGRKGHF